MSNLCDEIINNPENNKIACAIFLDLAKAFDAVNQAMLLQKLHTYGIRGIALDLFESYLKNKKHYTVVHGVSGKFSLWKI